MTAGSGDFSSLMTQRAYRAPKCPWLGYLQVVRTTSHGSAPAYRYHRPSWRRPLIVLTVIAVLLGVGAYVAYTAYQRYVVQLLTVPGCQAGAGDNAIALDFGQAADAATIAAVATRERLPARALTIAYATALQESKLENLPYGDLDSVGIFQQRPSMGWGSAKDLQDPAFASRAFFRALVKVPDYTAIPVYQAAQDVQRSADGQAYDQYAQSGALLARFYTTAPHAVTCWYNPGTQAANDGVSAKLNLTAAEKGLADAFGKPQAGSAVTQGPPNPFRTGGGGQGAVLERLGGGQLADGERELVRDYPGQLRGIPVDSRTDRIELAAGPERECGGYCRQLAGRTTILCGN